MKKNENQEVVVKLIKEINQLQNKNESQENFLEALTGIESNSTFLSQIVQKDSLFTNTSLSEAENIVSGIRIKPEEWEEIGIRLGEGWKNND